MLARRLVVVARAVLAGAGLVLPVLLLLALAAPAPAAAGGAAAPPPPLRYYLHGHDAPGTAGGFTMNATPPPAQLLRLELLDAPRWYGDPPLSGTFPQGSAFTLVTPCLLGLTVAPRYALAATAPDGGAAQELGHTGGLLGLCLGQQRLTIPVATR